LSGLETLTQRAGVTIEEMSSKDGQWSDYQLDPPLARIRLFGGGPVWQMDVGGLSPTGDGVYVRIAGTESVLRTETNLLEWIPVHAIDWRDRRVFSMKAAEGVRLELRRPEGGVRLVRTKASGWKLQQPVSARVDPGFPEAFLLDLVELQILEHGPEGEDQEAFGFKESGLELVVEGATRGPAEQVLRIGRTVPDHPDQVYAVRGHQPKRVFTVSTQVVSWIRTPLLSIRDRRLAPLSVEKVSGVKIEWKGRSLEFKKESGPWRMGTPLSGDADKERVEMIIQAWTEAQVVAFIDPPFPPPWNQGWDTAQGEILFRVGADPGQETRITIHSTTASNGQWIARVEGEDSLAVLNSELTDTLTLDPMLFKDLTVLRIQDREIRSLTMVSAGQTIQAVRSTNGTWSVENAAAWGPEALKPILRALSDLRAAAWIRQAPRDLGDFGLDQPEARLTLQLESSEGLILELWIGRESGGGRYAMIRGREDVFLLASETCKILMTPFATASGVPAETGN
jgi:hypothetical protein